MKSSYNIRRKKLKMDRYWEYQCKGYKAKHKNFSW
jgi:hypothetical protein